MSEMIVIFNDLQQPVGTATPSPDARPLLDNHRLMPAGTPFFDASEKMLAPDGTYQWNLLGRPCFAGGDGRTPARVPLDVGLIGKSWGDLAMLKSAENPHGLLQASRALTATEMQASDAARKAGRVLSPLQIRLAANHLGLRDEIEALIADPATPRNFRDYWEYASEYRRDHPLWPQALSLIGKTAADLDALYDLGQTF